MLGGAMFSIARRDCHAIGGRLLDPLVCFLKNAPSLNRVNNEGLDLSYGTHPFAWPIENWPSNMLWE
jgi:hypothetical protein